MLYFARVCVRHGCTDKCASLTKQAFSLLTNNSTPFYCPHCHLKSQATEIQELKEAVKKLTSELNLLKSSSNIESPTNPPSHQNSSESESINRQKRLLPQVYSFLIVSTMLLYMEFKSAQMAHLNRRETSRMLTKYYQYS